MDTALSDHARIGLAIIREAVRRELLPTPFTSEVTQLILDVLQLSDQESQQIQEILKADIRETAAMSGALGLANDLIRRVERQADERQREGKKS